MRIEPVPIVQKNKIVQDYLAGKLSTFFSYSHKNYEMQRLDDLNRRTFPRKQLANLLMEMNARWDAPEATKQEILRLKDENSVVVIGGQQAGLLTGPLYTINKIISIIKYAREQEKKLNIPVIPVFWIAGEDHDYDEINHIFTITENRIVKRMTKQQEMYRKSIGDIEIDKAQTIDWLKEIFNDLMETEHTKTIVDIVTSSLEKSTSFVDFFARLIYRLFPNEGIVLVNSADDALRKFESASFVQLIHKQANITQAVYETAQSLLQNGYHLQVDVSVKDGNIFYHDENSERILLRKEGALWVGKNDEVSFTTEQLLQIAEQQPEKLSNNVITRPLMQEAIFPTLAFFAGDGEISYWVLLKNAFATFNENIKMPPIIPRLSFTFITKRIEKLLYLRALQADYIVNYGCEKLQMNWLVAQENPPIEILFQEAEEKFNHIHQPLREYAFSVSDHLGNESEKNWEYIQKQLAYLKRKTVQHLERKYTFELNQFKEVNNYLRPNNSLQERVLNVIPLVNITGINVIQQLIEQPVSFDDLHYLVYV